MSAALQGKQLPTIPSLFCMDINREIFINTYQFLSIFFLFSQRQNLKSSIETERGGGSEIYIKFFFYGWLILFKNSRIFSFRSSKNPCLQILDPDPNFLKNLTYIRIRSSGTWKVKHEVYIADPVKSMQLIFPLRAKS